ncbi:unnamed protein product [Amoebophrya sp. A120]|nr:unnamed protein product [Amoebophrya sp. A120]|eukprot:GSA120T00022195001.1
MSSSEQQDSSSRRDDRRARSRSRSPRVGSKSSSNALDKRENNRPQHSLSTTANSKYDTSNFYVRYYVGHRGKFGHEFLEFELRSNGRLRYANNSNYKNDTMIRKEAHVTKAVIETLLKIVVDSDILTCDDDKWPEPDRVGRQELEIIHGRDHISFTTSKIGKIKEVHESNDKDGLEKFYYLVQDLKCFVFSLMSLHFRINPVSKAV